MKFLEVRNLSIIELKKRRDSLVEDLFQARIKNSLGQLANPISIRVLRRDIARINTAIGFKKIS